MKMCLLLFVTIGMLFSSCGTYRFNKTSDFGKISDLSELNGTYQNKVWKAKSGYEVMSMIGFFAGAKELRAYTDDTKEIGVYNDTDMEISLNWVTYRNIDTVTIRFLDDNTLQVSCLVNDTVFSKEFTGKKKKKYFEFYYSKKQLIIPFIYNYIEVDRLRIGRYKKTNDLLIRNLDEHIGFFLFLGTGHGGERPYVYKRIVEN